MQLDKIQMAAFGNLLHLKQRCIDKHSNFLGISSLGHGSAVALLNEHGILFAIEEEKLNRLHDSTEVPRRALDRCLLENHLKISDCRAVGLADRTIASKSSFSAFRPAWII